MSSGNVPAYIKDVASHVPGLELDLCNDIFASPALAAGPKRGISRRTAALVALRRRTERLVEELRCCQPGQLPLNHPAHALAERLCPVVQRQLSELASRSLTAATADEHAYAAELVASRLRLLHELARLRLVAFAEVVSRGEASIESGAGECRADVSIGMSDRGDGGRLVGMSVKQIMHARATLDRMVARHRGMVPGEVLAARSWRGLERCLREDIRAQLRALKRGIVSQAVQHRIHSIEPGARGAALHADAVAADAARFAASAALLASQLRAWEELLRIGMVRDPQWFRSRNPRAERKAQSGRCRA
jgi:hypothetical protein